MCDESAAGVASFHFESNQNIPAEAVAPKSAAWHISDRGVETLRCGFGGLCLSGFIREIREIRSQNHEIIPSEWLVCKANSVETEVFVFLLAADFADFADKP